MNGRRRHTGRPLAGGHTHRPALAPLGRKVRSDVAMTGEATLRGRVSQWAASVEGAGPSGYYPGDLAHRTSRPRRHPRVRALVTEPGLRKEMTCSSPSAPAASLRASKAGDRRRLTRITRRQGTVSGHLRGADHLLGRAPDQEMTQPGASVRTHHDGSAAFVCAAVISRGARLRDPGRRIDALRPGSAAIIDGLLGRRPQLGDDLRVTMARGRGAIGSP